MYLIGFDIRQLMVGITNLQYNSLALVHMNENLRHFYKLDPTSFSYYSARKRSLSSVLFRKITDSNRRPVSQTHSQTHLYYCYYYYMRFVL